MASAPKLRYHMDIEVRLLRIKRFVPIALAFTAALTLFQNCGQMTAPKNHVESDSSSTGSTQYGGNGSGYDGKIYVHLNDGTTCSDGSIYDASLEGRDGQVYLVRENCANIPKALQVAVQVETSPLSPGVVIYQGRVYHERILLIDDSASGLDNSRLLAGNGFTVDDKGALSGSVGLLARYNSDGTPAWMKTGDILNFAYKNFAELPSGDFAMVTTRLDSTGNVVRLNALGEPMWAKALAKATGFTVGFWFSGGTSDLAGNIYLAGGIQDGTSQSAGGFLMKLDGDGNLIWVRTILAKPELVPGPAPHSMSSAVVYAGSSGIFLKGNLKGVPFVARFNDIGQYYWVKTFDGFKSGFGTIHRADMTSLISLNDTNSSLLVELDPWGEPVSAQRLTAPTGYSSAFVGNLLLAPDGSTTATGYVGNASTRAGIVLTRANDGSVRAQWQVTIGGYTSMEFPKMGRDGVIWGEAHVPFAAGALLTSIMVRWDPTKPAPSCPFCSTPNLPMASVTPPTAASKGNIYSDQFLTVTPAARPVFTDLPADSFAF